MVPKQLTANPKNHALNWQCANLPYKTKSQKAESKKPMATVSLDPVVVRKNLLSHKAQMRKAGIVMITVWGGMFSACVGGMYWVHVTGGVV